MLIRKFWGVASDLLFLNWYSNILKCKHIAKQPDNNNIQQIDNFFHIIIEAIVIVLSILFYYKQLADLDW